MRETHGIANLRAKTLKLPNDLYKSSKQVVERLLGSAELQGLHSFCWSRERNAYTPHEENWLVRIGHAAVHQWAVPVPLDVRTQTLLSVAPLDLAPLLTVNRQTIKNCHGLKSLLILLEIHKAVPKDGGLLEIEWDINEIVQTTKANFIQDPAELVVRTICGQILHNESCAAITSRCELLSGYLRLE